MDLGLTQTFLEHFLDSLDSLATQILKHFFVNVPLEPYPYPMFSLLLSTWNDLRHPPDTQGY